ncbi:uncharacterized protein LOC106050221 isoform X2 [Biomphalaria glabrata]|uniref:Uncharacterized protein LOC106050221 isoform X2 n=1 Tax=Biomphalaria glabrata TaxID=6526 RepID=A0A9W2ZCU7_BIOGL|nr:uncharacterized protein LOC106050221 isoform X2 [Biomphalaria glabrata]
MTGLHLSLMLLICFILWSCTEMIGSKEFKYYLLNATEQSDSTAYICSYKSKAVIDINCPGHGSGNDRLKGNSGCLGFALKSDVLERVVTLDAYRCTTQHVHSSCLKLGFCRVRSSERISIMVFVSNQNFNEAYTPLPVSQWGKEYHIVLRRLSGFALIISEMDVALTVDYIETDGQHNVEYSIMHKNSVLSLQSCSVTDRHNSIADYIEIMVVSSGPLSGLSGHCGGDQSNIAIEALLPVEKPSKFEYVVFCVRIRSCTVLVQSPMNALFYATNMASGRIDSYTEQKNKKYYLIVDHQIFLQSEKYLLVSILILESGVAQATCSILPTSLFTSEYVWLLPSGFGLHLIIFISYISLGHLILNQKPLWSHKYSIYEERFKAQTWHIITVEKHASKEDYFKAYSVNGDIFGCYLIGVNHTMTYAVPVSFSPYHQIIYIYDKTWPFNRLQRCPTESMVKGDNVDNDCDGYIDEELANNKDDDGDNKVDEDLSTDTDNGCLPGWFGTNCDQLCHCERSQCLSNGTCRPGVLCERSYFGTQCQFRDAIMWATVSQKEVPDIRTTACFLVTSRLVISFYKNTRLSWIQITTASKEHLRGLTLMFVKTHNRDYCVTGPCLNRRDIYVTLTTLIIHCNTSSYVCQMIILFDDYNMTRKVCAIHVSAGRNIALRKHVAMSSVQTDRQGRISRETLCVDGYIEDNITLCSRTSLIDTKPNLKMTFPLPVVIDEIVIYFGGVDKIALQLGEKFQIRLLDNKKAVVSDITRLLDRHVSIVPLSRDPVKYIHVSMSPNFYSLAICEFENAPLRFTDLTVHIFAVSLAPTRSAPTRATALTA